MITSSRSSAFLTFDDGPDPVWTSRVLAGLRANDARATFFVIGPRARRNPALIHEMIADGHAIGLHCTRHLRHTDLVRSQVEADTRAGLRDLRLLGLRPRLWRPPWGVLAPWTTCVARGFGLDLVPWTADTHDWRGDNTREMLGAVDQDLGPGSVILMHDGLGPGARRTGCEETVALIDGLIGRLRDLGCEPMPLLVTDRKGCV